MEQLAGDQIPTKDDAERDEALTATGFLALGPKNLLGNKSVFPHDMADDQINVTMRAITALTVSCARCHDHKFDPISTERVLRPGRHLSQYRNVVRHEAWERAAAAIHIHPI